MDAPYGAERKAYARAILDERDIRAYLDAVGMLDERAPGAPGGAHPGAVRRVAASRRRELGLSPMSHARLLPSSPRWSGAHPDLTGGGRGGLDALLVEGGRR